MGSRHWEEQCWFLLSTSKVQQSKDELAGNNFVGEGIKKGNGFQSEGVALSLKWEVKFAISRSASGILLYRYIIQQHTTQNPLHKSYCQKSSHQILGD